MSPPLAVNLMLPLYLRPPSALTAFSSVKRKNWLECCYGFREFEVLSPETTGVKEKPWTLSVVHPVRPATCHQVSPSLKLTPALIDRLSDFILSHKYTMKRLKPKVTSYLLTSIACLSLGWIYLLFLLKITFKFVFLGLYFKIFFFLIWTNMDIFY